MNSPEIIQTSHDGVNIVSDNILLNFASDTKPLDQFGKSSESPKAFIIHGHNEARLYELQSILIKLGVQPIILAFDGLNGKSIMENIEAYSKECVMAFAVFTYDDVVQKENREYLQVRPNVIFELGYFYAKLGRENVMILEQENQKGSIFSDIDGIYRYQFVKKIEELKEKIAGLVNKFK